MSVYKCLGVTCSGRSARTIRSYGRVYGIALQTESKDRFRINCSLNVANAAFDLLKIRAVRNNEHKFNLNTSSPPM